MQKQIYISQEEEFFDYMNYPILEQTFTCNGKLFFFGDFQVGVEWPCVGADKAQGRG